MGKKSRFIRGGFITLMIMIIFVSISLFQMGRPLSQLEASELIEARIKAHLEKAKDTDQGVVSIEWPSKGIQQTWAYEKNSEQHLNEIDKGKPFHIASVGKTFTAVLIMKLKESERLDLDKPVVNYLPKAVLKGLFDYEGTDYSDVVTTRQLLAHTSGVADYFGDPVTSGKTTEILITSEPDQFWTPEMILSISRERQTAVGKPGERFHYSDTGYVLLGLLIEALYEKPLEACLSDEIFKPLGMNDSYLMFYGKPLSGKSPALSKIWFKGHELSQKRSLSIDWAGGGIISTAEDLQKFNLALKTNQLISEESYSEMSCFDQVFMTGIDYGLGLMSFDFEKFFFLLKGLPKLEGHMGILSCFMLQDPTSDLSIVINFGSDSHNEAGVKLMIELMQILMRIKN